MIEQRVRVKLMIPDLWIFSSNLYLVITLIWGGRKPNTPNKQESTTQTGAPVGTSYISGKLIPSVPWKMMLNLPEFCILQSDLRSCTEVLGHCSVFTLSWALPAIDFHMLTRWLNPILEKSLESCHQLVRGLIAG